MRDLQMDVHSLEAEQLMAAIRPLLPDAAAAAILRDWDLCYAPDSEGAYIFEKVYRAFLEEVFQPIFGAEVFHHVLYNTAILADFYDFFARVLLDPGHAFYRSKSRDECLRAALARALIGDVKTWGSAQRVTMKHMIFGGKLPRALGFDFGPVAIRGGRATIHQGQVFRNGERENTFVPSFRMITDLSQPVLYTVVAGGPSDRRFSPYYVSEVRDWLNGRLKVVRLT